LKANNAGLLSLWLVEQIIEVIEDEKEVTDKVLKIAQQTIKQKWYA
jgi:hypothetical protein